MDYFQIAQKKTDIPFSAWGWDSMEDVRSTGSERDVREVRQYCLDELQELQRTVEDEGRNYKPEEDRLFNALEGIIKRCDSRITDQGEAPDIRVGNPERPRRDGRLQVENPGYDNVGAFMQDVYRHAVKNEPMNDRLQALEKAARSINETTGYEGGWAVPTQFVDSITQPENAVEDSVLLPRVDRQPMERDQMSIPGYADSDHSSGSPYGLSWQQVGEGETFGESSVTLEKVSLQAHKTGTLVYITNEWLDDSSSSMRQRLEGIFSRSLRWYLDGLLISNGTGVGEPVAVLNAGAALEVSKEGSQTADTIVTQNIVNMFSRAYPGMENRGIWLANKTTLPELSTLTLEVGTSGGSEVGLLQQGRVAGELRQTIFGRPVYWTEHCKALGTAGDIMFVDPLLYVLGERGAVTIEASPHVKFDSDQTAFRIKARYDGRALIKDVLTPENGDTLSPFIYLETRS